MRGFTALGRFRVHGFRSVRGWSSGKYLQALRLGCWLVTTLTPLRFPELCTKPFERQWHSNTCFSGSCREGRKAEVLQWHCEWGGGCIWGLCRRRFPLLFWRFGRDCNADRTPNSWYDRPACEVLEAFEDYFLGISAIGLVPLPIAMALPYRSFRNWATDYC